MERIVMSGRFFYKYRGIIALPAFLLLLYFSKPESRQVLSHILIICGLLIRFWASGYIGEKARTKELKAEYRISNGPFGILRHPLYIGNFFLVSGTVLLYNPPLWFKIIIIAIFLIEYTIIIIAEETHLKRIPVCRLKFSFRNVKSEIQTFLVMAVIYLIYLWVLRRI